MKILWSILPFCFCCCSISFAQVPGKTRIAGFSDQYKSENTLGEYTFGYNEDHTSGGSFRRETSDRFGNKIGSYGLRIGDGRVRIVNYVADQNGFRAEVVSNEPGIESQDSNEFSKITKKNIYKILVPGYRYASQAPYVAFDTDQSSSNFRDDDRYTSESPQLTFGNDQSSSNFPDDVKYTSDVTKSGYEADQSSSKFSGDVIDEVGLQYDPQVSNLDSEGNVFLFQDGDTGDTFPGEEGDGANIDSNDDNSYAKAFSDDEGRLDDFYSNEEVFDGGYDDDDEYKRASETVPQNETIQWQVQNGSDGFPTSMEEVTTKSSIESRNNFSPLIMKDENETVNPHQKSDITNEDLHTNQSKVGIVKSSEHVTSQDTKNSTVTVKVNKDVTRNVHDDTAVA